MTTYCPATAWLYSTSSPRDGSGLVIVGRGFGIRFILQLDHGEKKEEKEERRGEGAREERRREDRSWALENNGEVWGLEQTNHVVVHLAA